MCFISAELLDLTQASKLLHKIVTVRDILAISPQRNPAEPLHQTLINFGCKPDEHFRFLATLEVRHADAAVKAVGLQKACLYVKRHDEDPFHKHDPRFKDPLTEEMTESLLKAFRSGMRPDLILLDAYCFITEILIRRSEDQAYEWLLADQLATYIEEVRSNHDLGRIIRDKMSKTIQLSHSAAFFCFLVKNSSEISQF